MTTYSMIAWDTGSQQDVMWTTTDYSAIPLSTETSPNYTGTLVEICILDDGGESATSLIQTTFLANNTVVGTTPTLVASWQLPANTYTPPKALFGCGDPTHTATLQLKKQDGTLLVSFTAQGVNWHTAPLGFTLAAEQMVDLVLFSDHTSAAAFIHSFTF